MHDYPQQFCKGNGNGLLFPVIGGVPEYPILKGVLEAKILDFPIFYVVVSILGVSKLSLNGKKMRGN